MKVSELIDELAKLPPDDEIVAWDGADNCPSLGRPTIEVMWDYSDSGQPSVREGVWQVRGDWR